MILTIDIGNSYKKYCLFNDRKIIKSEKYNSHKKLEMLFKDKVKSIIISSVRREPSTQDSPWWQSSLRIKDLVKEGMLLSMPIDYDKGLGDDRAASAFYIFKKFKGRSLCLDTGTFTTADMISNKGFQGGYILPGLNLLAQSYTKGDLLNVEKISSKNSHFNPLPKDTRKAITEGLKYSYFAPLLLLIENTKPDQIIITGGNANLLKEFLTSHLDSVNLQSIDHLVHRGLHLIAEEIKK